MSTCRVKEIDKDIDRVRDRVIGEGDTLLVAALDPGTGLDQHLYGGHRTYMTKQWTIENLMGLCFLSGSPSFGKSTTGVSVDGGIKKRTNDLLPKWLWPHRPMRPTAMADVHLGRTRRPARSVAAAVCPIFPAPVSVFAIEMQNRCSSGPHNATNEQHSSINVLYSIHLHRHTDTPVWTEQCSSGVSVCCVNFVCVLDSSPTVS